MTLRSLPSFSASSKQRLHVGAAGLDDIDVSVAFGGTFAVVVDLIELGAMRV